MKEIQEIVSKYDLVLYILGYGSLSGGEHYCQKAVKLAKEHFQDSSIHIVDVVGQPKLIDDLQYCCNKRPWPLIFYQVISCNALSHSHFFLDETGEIHRRVF